METSQFHKSWRSTFAGEGRVCDVAEAAPESDNGDGDEGSAD